MNSAEIRVLLSSLDTALSEGKCAAVASVVGVSGSAYRREGTKMLVLDDSSQFCMLSGGCLEAEVVEEALGVIKSGISKLVHYNLSEDATWGLGLGCGGSVSIWIEKVRPENTLFKSWLSALSTNYLAVNATILGSGEKVFISEESVISEITNKQLEQEIIQEASRLLSMIEPKACTIRLSNGEEVFFDTSRPSPQLVLYGAGHDAVPLAAQAHAFGYKVHVIDARPAYLTKGRFGEATLHLLNPEDLDSFSVPDKSQAVIMNHHIDKDRACLAHALISSAEYIGVLGPMQRTTDLLRELSLGGASFSEKQLKRLRSPVGLRIGAESPEEVAMSILAELMAWRRGYDGGFLSGYAGKIHKNQTGYTSPS